ncbi:MAG: aminodeoxychorismate synthase component I [Saprospiraceae bacterium]|nr:aminodeoxychorismate synthase component I [Saprospiraceae bacterium]
MNLLGRLRCPFLFLIDFEMKRPLVLPIHDLPDEIQFNFNGVGKESFLHYAQSISDFSFKKLPISKDEYTRGFNVVMDSIHKGDTFLTNLTFPTRVETSLTMDEMYLLSKAKYKLKFYNEWMVFSPEPFIKIEGGIISTFPMKGTIDASIPNADNIILNDHKEMAEHNTVVDLLRNDLSRVARKVHVSHHRYIDRIKTHNKEILQVSSAIQGSIKDYYHDHLGELLLTLLPAGSISGAPKKKTCQIIRTAEGQPRGYYTGIAAYYDGYNVDSCVLIRYIENKNDHLIARSGGGITFMSNLDAEYQEMIDKVYVPINRNHKNRQQESDEYQVAQSTMPS